jgi:hypothetical protein
MKKADSIRSLLKNPSCPETPFVGVQEPLRIRLPKTARCSPQKEVFPGTRRLQAAGAGGLQPSDECARCFAEPPCACDFE